MITLPDSTRCWSALGTSRRIGRNPATGGYRRFAWTRRGPDPAGVVRRRGRRRAASTLTQDRAGNQWAWWGDPDAAVSGRPGLVIGSHLDSVPDGGAYDGPLGVVSALRRARRAAGAGVHARPGRSASPASPTRRVPGSASPAPARGCSPARSTPTGPGRCATPTASPWPRRWPRPGTTRPHLGPDPETLRRIGTFVELHVEQGRGLVDLGAPGRRRASAIWPHGRWRFDLDGRGQPRGHHPAGRPPRPDAGATPRPCCAARAAARAPRRARDVRQGAGGTQRRQRDPVPGHRLARRPRPGRRSTSARVVAGRRRAGRRCEPVEESWTPETPFDAALRRRGLAPAGSDGRRPVLSTGAGHDAGILARRGSRPRCCSSATRPGSRTPRGVRRAGRLPSPASRRWRASSASWPR